MTTPAIADGTALYRIRGDADLLLYIGISKDFGRRWRDHARKQPWWSEMQSLSVDRWYESRSEAEDAEKAAIKAEKPKYNKKHTDAPEPHAASRAKKPQIFYGTIATIGGGRTTPNTTGIWAPTWSG